MRARPVGFEPTSARLEAGCLSARLWARWPAEKDSNPQPPRSKRGALPLCYRRVGNYVLRRRNLEVVCAAGFEPAASRSQAGRSDLTELRAGCAGRGRAFMGWSGLRESNSRCRLGRPLLPTEKPAYWWRRSASNRRASACRAGALPTELRPQVVGAPGMELNPRPRPLRKARSATELQGRWSFVFGFYS